MLILADKDSLAEEQHYPVLSHTGKTHGELGQSIRTFYERLFPVEPEERTVESPSSDSEVEEQDFRKKLMKVKEKSSPSKAGKNGDNTTVSGHGGLNAEITAYKRSGVRSERLEKLYGALLNISPTSVPSERAFSTSGRQIRKERPKLSFKTANNLVFLKSYFEYKDIKK